AAPANGLSNAATRRPDRIYAHPARCSGRQSLVQPALWRHSGSNLRRRDPKKDSQTGPLLLRQVERVDAFWEMRSNASGVGGTPFARPEFRRVWAALRTNDWLLHEQPRPPPQNPQKRNSTAQFQLAGLKSAGSASSLALKLGPFFS